MPPFDPEYLNAALETITLIRRLLTYYQQQQTMEKFLDNLTEIEIKSQAEVEASSLPSSMLKEVLEIDLPVVKGSAEPSSYWQGVRDLTRIIIKRWTQTAPDIPAFHTVLLKIKQELEKLLPTKPVNPLEEIISRVVTLGGPNDQIDPSLPTPFVYYPPYPKPPPEGMARAQEKKSPSQEVDYSVEESVSEKNGFDQDSKDSPPLTQLILEKSDENDALLSKSLREVLKLLRDEE
jgi:hypothetical protein